MAQDFYDILSVSKNASPEEIKKAYRRLAMQHHPDRNAGNPQSEAEFKKINEAYSVLSDDSKRRQYDTYGSTGNSWFSGGGFQGDVDLWDIFESFFWGGFSSGSRKKTTEFRGEDLEYRMKIDLKTSIYGGKQKIHFEKLESCSGCDGEGGEWKRTCTTCAGKWKVVYTSQSPFWVIQQTRTCDECQGSGATFEEVCHDCRGKKRSHNRKEIEIDIPAWIDNGMTIKLQGEGNDGVWTKQSWDLYVHFLVENEEKWLTRDGVDLHYEVEIDILEAILGTQKEVSIPILGKRIFKIEAGTQFATEMKITGDGVKYIDRDKKGDLFFHIDIKIPKKLSKEERTHYEEIAKEKKLNVNSQKGVFEKLFG
jgi:molecular chaperone DnaJ